MLKSALRPRWNDMNPDPAPTVTKSDDEWKKQLTPEQLHVAPAAWHRAPLLKPTQPREASRPLQVRLLRRFAVLVERQVRFEHRLAQLLGAGRQWSGERTRGGL